MPRIKLILQYRGTDYHGWQVQPNGLTIQEVLEKTLARILQQKVHVVAAGRTDAGVHALGQAVHFDIKNVPMCRCADARPERSRRVPMSGIKKLILGLNSLLPPDIAVTKAEIVPSIFHAQKSVKKKIYDYFILNSPIKSPFLHEYTWQIPYELDLRQMRQAAKVLVGEHDFKAFCASGSTAKTTVRRIYSIRMGRRSQIADRFFDPRPAICDLRSTIRVSITGNGFLKHMVRNIVGTLVEVGRRKKEPNDMRRILHSKNRKKAGPTAPAKGLVLRGGIY